MSSGSTVGGSNAESVVNTNAGRILTAINTTKRKRRQNKTDEQFGEEMQPLINKFYRGLRWMIFMQFTYKAGLEGLLLECFPDVEDDPDSAVVQYCRERATDLCKSWKFSVIDNMEAWVRREIDKADSPIKTMTNAQQIGLEFQRLFDEDTFLQVWDYMEGYIDYRESSELGKYYIKTIFSQLATYVKLHVDWDIDGQNGAKHNRKDLLHKYDLMATQTRFKNLEKSHFKERFITPGSRKTKKPKRVAEPIDLDGDLYVPSGPAPTA